MHFSGRQARKARHWVPDEDRVSLRVIGGEEKWHKEKINVQWLAHPWPL